VFAPSPQLRPVPEPRKSPRKTKPTEKLAEALVEDPLDFEPRVKKERAARSSLRGCMLLD
jgi:hypothetical protein